MAAGNKAQTERARRGIRGVSHAGGWAQGGVGVGCGTAGPATSGQQRQ
jgi:hypothetical protein